MIISGPSGVGKDTIIEAVRSTEEALIIMGDFNEEWANEDSVVRALVKEAGMQVYQAESPNHATYKDKRLDWILLSRDLAFATYRSAPDTLSDHRAVIADIRPLEGEPE